MTTNGWRAATPLQLTHRRAGHAHSITSRSCRSRMPVTWSRYGQRDSNPRRNLPNVSRKSVPAGSNALAAQFWLSGFDSYFVAAGPAGECTCHDAGLPRQQASRVSEHGLSRPMLLSPLVSRNAPKSSEVLVVFYSLFAVTFLGSGFQRL